MSGYLNRQVFGIGSCHVGSALHAAGCTRSQPLRYRGSLASLPHPRTGVAHVLFMWHGDRLVSAPVNRWRALVSTRVLRTPIYLDYFEPIAAGRQLIVWSNDYDFANGELYHLTAALIDWPSGRQRDVVQADWPPYDSAEYEAFLTARHAAREAWRAAQEASPDALINWRYSADLSRLVVVRNDRRVQAWQLGLADTTPRSTLPPLTLNPLLPVPPLPPDWTLHVPDAVSAVISHDGTRLAVHTRDALLLFAPPQPTPIATLPRATAAAFSPDGGLLAVVEPDPVGRSADTDALVLYAAVDGALLDRRPLTSLLSDVQFAADGRTLLVVQETWQREQQLLYFDVGRAGLAD